MNLKGRMKKIEKDKQPALTLQICFQNPKESLEDAKKRVLKGGALSDDWLIIRWLSNASFG